MPSAAVVLLRPCPAYRSSALTSRQLSSSCTLHAVHIAWRHPLILHETPLPPLQSPPTAPSLSALSFSQLVRSCKTPQTPRRLPLLSPHVS